jgi:hypothetical protein
MGRFKREAAIVTTLLAIAGCATTEFESTWVAPSVEKGELQGKQVAAIVLSDHEALRRSGEDALARALSAHGLIGVPGYQLLTAEDAADSDQLRKKLAERNMAGMVMIRLLDSRQVATYPGFYAPYWGIGPYYGYGRYGWDPVTSRNVVTAETMVYSLPDNNLLWAGVSDTVDPHKLDWMIGEIADKAAKEMKRQGLILH